MVWEAEMATGDVDQAEERCCLREALRVHMKWRIRPAIHELACNQSILVMQGYRGTINIFESSLFTIPASIYLLSSA